MMALDNLEPSNLRTMILVFRILSCIVSMFILLQPAEISSSNKDKHDMSKSSKAKNSINGSKDSEKLKKSSTSSNSSNIKTAATNKKAVKVEGAFGNDLKKATVTSNEPSSTKTTTSTTVSNSVQSCVSVCHDIFIVNIFAASIRNDIHCTLDFHIDDC